MTRRWTVSVLLLLAGLSLGYWYRPHPETDAIRRQIDALRIQINSAGGSGLANVARAAQIGSLFTDDVVVDLGQGTAPIEGRDTVMGMAARLQPRTEAFRLQFDDVGVELEPGKRTANVSLTASFIGRSAAAGETSIDAREFALQMRKVGDSWLIARVTAVSPVR